MTNLKCADCKEEILAAKVELCPYCKSTNLIQNVIKTVDISKELARIAKLEKVKQYTKAAKEYENLEMHSKANKCKKLAIIQATKLEQAGHYEKAANTYEDLEMWEKACKTRKLKKIRHVPIPDTSQGQVISITMKCPHCNIQQPLTSKTNQVTCTSCKKNYNIPPKVLDLL
jgi:RNA polymerase subunit RPABC4/transcription elongation factor Spt4